MDVAKQQRQKRKKYNKTLTLTKIMFVLVFVWFVGNSLISFLLGLFVDTQLVRIETFEEKYQTEGYILRDEVVIVSPSSGIIKNLVPSGERVSKNAVVFAIIGSGGTALQAGDPVLVKAPTAGIISYNIDGLEEYFQPNELQNLDMQKIEKLDLEPVDNNKINVVKKGKRVCKIVNNLEGLQVYLEFPVDIFNEPLQLNQSLNLRFPTINREARASIVDLKGIGNVAQVLVEIPETWYSLINMRRVPIEIIIEKQEGIKISKKALVKKGEENGVYLLRKGFVFWQAVNVVSEEEQFLIIQDIEPLTEIILNPGLVKEGQHLN